MSETVLIELPSGASRSSSGGTAGVLLGGLGLGALIFLLLKNLGGRGPGAGAGAGSDDRGTALLTTPRPRDAQRLAFVMTAPTATAPMQPMTFRLDDVDYSFGEMLARIWAGGRTDVALTFGGAVKQGAVDQVKDMLRSSGIQLWSSEGTKVAGEPRGLGIKDGRGYGPYDQGYYRDTHGRVFPLGPDGRPLPTDYDFQPGPDGSYLPPRSPRRRLPGARVAGCACERGTYRRWGA